MGTVFSGVRRGVVKLRGSGAGRGEATTGQDGTGRDGVVVRSPKFLQRNFTIKKNIYRERIHTIINFDFDEECVRCIKEEQTVI